MPFVISLANKQIQCNFTSHKTQDTSIEYTHLLDTHTYTHTLSTLLYIYTFSVLSLSLSFFLSTRRGEANTHINWLVLRSLK